MRGYIYLGIMILVGSATSPLAKLVVSQLPVGLVPLLRFGFAGLCLIPFIGGVGPLKALVRHDWRRLAVVAAFCVPINQWFFLNAARLGTNAHVGLFYAMVPLVVWVLAWRLGHERLDLSRLGGILVSISGVVVIGVGNLLGGESSSPEQTRAVMLSDLLLIGAVISWGAYVALSRPLVLRHGAMPVLAGTFLFGFFLQIPIALATATQWPSMLKLATPSAWISLIVLAGFFTPLNLALQNLSLRRLDASQVATFSNVAPVLTVVWGVWLFHEALSPALVVGGLLTLGGVIWTSRPAPAASRAAARTSLAGEAPAACPID
ncbi:MAG: DMT family transporter [Paludisphaera borealis]|uniref:DMT family transporter n=1 Tax=Paludisphaera borealis TaxID=1387353 RepID=UPI00283B8168|nr:DMT family transporter [Paludisphaera borealis]MDR3619478.1 DMT family transporter [Paludisphaera borealis]